MTTSHQVVISFLFFCLFLSPNGFALRSVFSVISESRQQHRPRSLEHDKLVAISDFLNDISVFNTTLTNILVPRVVGTDSHAKVRNYIVNSLSVLNWDVELDSFSSYTPLGQLQFNNIIATHNPHAKRFLDLACHYDSKYYPGVNKFVGATDSAVPCAMMIQIAHSLNELLNQGKNDEVSLRFIFFDGEEAFKAWSVQDSIYGARHLASKWRNTPYADGGQKANQLDRIDMLVLLDLLGAKNPKFYSFYPNTQHFFSMLVNAETKLNEKRLLEKYRERYFLRKSTDAYIEDDHLPFLRNNVPIIHLITVPFPPNWHTNKDDYDSIDFPTTKNLMKILGVFIAEYLTLNF